MSGFGLDNLDRVSISFENVMRKNFGSTSSSNSVAGELISTYLKKAKGQEVTWKSIGLVVGKYMQNMFFARMHVAAHDLPGDYTAVVLGEFYEWTADFIKRERRFPEDTEYLQQLSKLTYDFLTKYNGGAPNGNLNTIDQTVRKIYQNWR